MPDVEILTLPPLDLAGIFHRGPYTDLGQVFQRLVAWAEEHQAFRPETRVLAVAWDNPYMVAPEDLRSCACMTLPPEVTPDGPVEPLTLAGGRHASLVHRGSYEGLPDAYAWLIGRWLPASGETQADGPCFEEYLNDCRVLPEEQWLTRIYVPLKG
ncbi:MAG: GyrI-like domain-containing protein [Magnetospirillum sp.]|nr:GyrI-like domain-containing protein [Magnetospirillum sp.]